MDNLQNFDSYSYIKFGLNVLVMVSFTVLQS
jgi:hypothetical protein